MRLTHSLWGTQYGEDGTGLTHCLHITWRRQDQTHTLLVYVMGLTHCLRAWFLRLKYKISFFLIAWFLGSTDKNVGGGQLSAGAQAD